MTKIPSHKSNGMPILPDGHHWMLRTPHKGPARLAVNTGTVNSYGYSGSSHELAGADLFRKWHWLTRAVARRLYRKHVTDGQFVVPPPKIIERYEDRYGPIEVFNAELKNPSR